MKINPELFTEFLLKIQLRRIDNPISSKELEYSLGVDGTVIRALRREAQRQGYPIANTIKKADGSTQKIYFWAKTYDEISPTVQEMQSRALDMLDTASKIRKKFGLSEQPELF